MTVRPFKQDPEIQKKALKLFAAGYRPIINKPMPVVGKIDIAKVRKVRGHISPAILEWAAGISHYSKDQKNVPAPVYHALYRLCVIARSDMTPYEIMYEQHKI